MTLITRKAQSLKDGQTVPEVHAIGDVVDGRRWTGTTWEPAGAEGVASVPAPRHHNIPAPALPHPRR